MIRYIIIDDEYIAHDIIKSYCDLLPNLSLLKNCYDALEAFEFLQSNSVDLIFLDLNMPKLKGFDFLKTLSNPPKVIVTTAYKEFALEGYELNISDYLLKPFGFDRFLSAINKTFSTPVLPQSNAPISALNGGRIFVKSNKKYIQLTIDSILYLEASGNYTKIFSSSDVISIRDKVSNVLELLPKSNFIQVHKSFAVCVTHIKSIGGNQIFIGEHIVPIGKMFRHNITQLLK